MQGEINQAGEIAWGYLQGGGSRVELVAALGHALLAEDAEFHWFQVFEAAVRQASAWPDGSDESALILAGLARFLAAHTPTRRELPTIIRTATRLPPRRVAVRGDVRSPCSWPTRRFGPAPPPAERPRVREPPGAFSVVTHDSVPAPRECANIAT